MAGGFNHSVVSVCGYISFYLAVYGPEIIGGFGLEGETKAVCGLGRTNYGGLQNVRPPIIDPSEPLHCLVICYCFCFIKL